MSDRTPSQVGATPIYITDGRNYLRLDNSTASLQTISYDHHEIHEGDHYFVGGHESEDTNGTIEFVVTTPDTTTWAHMRFVIKSQLEMSVDVYEGTSGVSGGSSATPINNNRNSSNTSVLTLTKDPSSISDNGTLIDSYRVGNTSASGKTGELGQADAIQEIILKQNTTYLYRMTSHGDGNEISYKGFWYEHENEEKD